MRILNKSVNIFFCLLILSVLCSMLCIPQAFANNLAVSNATPVSQNTTTHTMTVQFNISWDNSWYDAVNYDAAWVFMKYSTDGGTTWNHATLKVTDSNNLTSGLGGVRNPTGFSQGTATYSGVSTTVDVDVPTEATSGKKGAFIHLHQATSGSGTYTLSVTGVQVVWDYGTDIGTSSANDNSAALALVDVMGVEMVYIPTGSFSLGSGGSETSPFYSAPTTTTPYVVSSESAITVGTATGNLYYASSTYGGDEGTPIPAAFPKGYAAFYIMKYDVSQGQYRDFLNTLTRTQQNTRTASQTASYYVMSNSSTVSYRNGIQAPATIPTGAITFVCNLSGTGANNSTDGEWVACSYLSWMDVCAYAAWAGVRPMTELEFEKACRGPNTPTANEYAWGTTDLTQATSITNSGANNEVAGQTGNGLCAEGNAAGVQGPLRCGFAATYSTTTRLTAGSSYWGVMDLSGNVWKRPVTVGNSQGRGFTGSHGTGILATDGNATNADWPGYASGEVTGATGSGFRGGSWCDGSTYARSSGRGVAARADTGRDSYYGARCVRTSP